MRYIAVSVLSFFVVLPGFAAVRLPVVNLSSAGVSARAAFGEPVPTPVKTETKSSVSVEKDTTRSSPKVVARSANTNRAVSVTPTDSGEQIVASSDILSPRRPSSDLWAHSSSDDVVPLRLPNADEFSVFRSDDLLPEEDLNQISLNSESRFADAGESVVADSVSEYSPMSELDAQIARLNELQRRAEESVNNNFARSATVQTSGSGVADDNRNVVSRPVTARTASVGSTRTVATNMPKASQVVTRANTVEGGSAVSEDDDDVKLSRLVVPMNDLSDDVVIRAVKKAESPRINSVREDMTKMSPSELRKAFRKTFLSENKHLSTFQIDDRFDEASDMTANALGFTSERSLTETGGIRPLEIKIKFRNQDAALSRDNYNLLTEYAGIVLTNPTRAVQVSIPQSVVNSADDRKLAARRLAIIEQVLRDNGISEQRILPVLSARDETDGLLLRMISLEQYETLTKKRRDIFGDTIEQKTYKSMSW